MNINRLLENSIRNELMGENLFTFRRANDAAKLRKWQEDEREILHPATVWGEPAPLMSGTLGISHHTDITDALTLGISKNGEALSLRKVRNRWTPSFMQTYYRSSPSGDYKRAGTVALKETKCITFADCFISHLRVFNDDSEPATLRIKINTPFEYKGGSIFAVSAKTLPRAMKVRYSLEGSFAAICTEGRDFEITLGANSYFDFRVAAAYSAKCGEKALALCEKSIKNDNVFEENEKEFNRIIEACAPKLTVDDPDILKVYYYRWYLLKKNSFTPKKLIPEHFIKEACIYESSTGDWYGCPVGLPLPMQINEARWDRLGKEALGQVKLWSKGENNIRSYIQYTPYAIWNLYKTSGNLDMLKRAYPAMLSYSAQGIDGRSLKLPVTVGSWQTGAEYQPSFYQHRDIEFDYRYDNRRNNEVGGEKAKLYRLDEICYKLASLYATGEAAKLLGIKKDAKMLTSICKELIETIKRDFFDEARGVFLDKDVSTGKLCDKAACYDSFAPFMFDLIRGEKYEDSLIRLLTDDKFLGEFSITTVERSCPMFWFDNAVAGPAFASKEKPDFYGCCWNGPVWPYADTIALTALGEAASHNAKYRDSFLSLFNSYNELHFYLGDKSLPDIVEHYRATDGVPFSVTHDYFHSNYIDLLMSYWAGIKVSADGKVSFKPLTRKEFSLEGVMIRGEEYSFRQYRKGGKLIKEIHKK